MDLAAESRVKLARNNKVARLRGRLPTVRSSIFPIHLLPPTSDTFPDPCSIMTTNLSPLPRIYILVIGELSLASRNEARAETQCSALSIETSKHTYAEGSTE